MKRLSVFLVLAVSCAHVSGYEQAAVCPSPMTEEQRLSGVVQCRALCSSYAREIVDFDSDCRCICAPAHGAPVYKTPTPGRAANTQT